MIKRVHSTLLLCKNITQTAEFYKKIGFLFNITNDSVRIIFGDYRLTFIDENVSSIKDDPETKKGVGIFMFFEVENVDSFYQILKGKDINILGEIEGRPGGKRRFTVIDPDGYKLVFFTPPPKPQPAQK